MKTTKLFTILAISSIATCLYAQLGGGSSAYREQRQTGLNEARANELAKRKIAPDDPGNYLDAAVLMNVEADEYIAIFGVNEEGTTLDQARFNMERAIAAFVDGLKQLKIAPSDYFVDFVSQNRIYGFDSSDKSLVKEVVVGFEVKKNISIRYKDKSLLNALTAAASKARIFDLVKVDYIVKDLTAIRAKLMEEASPIIKQKAEEQERLLGMKIGRFTVVYPGQVSTYFPTDMYESYVAQESEEVIGYRENVNIQRARKPKTFFYNGLNAKDFDAVINPVTVEPTVQFTLYVRVKY